MIFKKCYPCSFAIATAALGYNEIMIKKMKENSYTFGIEVINRHNDYIKAYFAEDYALLFVDNNNNCICVDIPLPKD
jgi:hypothetical protein